MVGHISISVPPASFLLRPGQLFLSPELLGLANFYNRDPCHAGSGNYRDSVSAACGCLLGGGEVADQSGLGQMCRQMRVCEQRAGPALSFSSTAEPVRSVTPLDTRGGAAPFGWPVVYLDYPELGSPFDVEKCLFRFKYWYSLIFFFSFPFSGVTFWFPTALFLLPCGFFPSR